MPIPKSKDDAARVLKIIDDALAKGWSISVHDGAEWTLRKSRDGAEIVDAICTSDEDRLSFWDEQIHLGLLYCIYGEPGGDGIFTDWQAAQTLNKFLEEEMSFFHPDTVIMRD